MSASVAIDSRTLWLIRDVERILAPLDAPLTADYRRGLESMTPSELMQLIIKLRHASAFNATTTLAQSITESAFARIDREPLH